MIRIAKEFAFSASHQLTHLAEAQPDHPCARLHGHNYAVVVELEGEELNKDGFVRDYRELDIVKRFIDDALDHRHLNDVRGGSSEQTTAESLARWLLKVFRGMGLEECVAVRVSETPKTWAEARIRVSAWAR